MTSKKTFFSIIIVSMNGAPVIAQCLDALRLTQWESYEVIVVDNGSTDDLAKIVRGYSEVRLIQSPVNLGFAGGNNLGISKSQDDIVVLLNDDTEVRPDWLSAWAAAAEQNPQWGIMGCKLLYPDGCTIQHAGGTMNEHAMTKHIGYEEPDDGKFDSLKKCAYVTGAAIAIRRSLVAALGPLDEKYFPIYFEETDYCWQVRCIGYEVLYVPDCVVIHHESRTQSRFSKRFYYRYHRGRLRFISKCFSHRELKHALRAELRWLTHFRFPTSLYLIYLSVYLNTLLRLPVILRDRIKFRRRIYKLARAMQPN